QQRLVELPDLGEADVLAPEGDLELGRETEQDLLRDALERAACRGEELAAAHAVEVRARALEDAGVRGDEEMLVRFRALERIRTAPQDEVRGLDERALAREIARDLNADAVA